MAVALFMDHNVPRAITIGLRLRQVDVLTAYEDGSNELDDPLLIDRARELGRVLFTRDDDLLVEAARRQRSGITFHGLVYAHQLRAPIRRCVDELELIAKSVEPEDLLNQIIFLPL
jgi:predicted nuclease of predicted toxin-antitoxin system